MEKVEKVEKLRKIKKLPDNENLSGDVLLALSETSKKMRETYASSSCNSLWKRKIKEDFNINYNKEKAFEEYKFLNRLSRTQIYNVIYFADFFEREDAKDNTWIESFITEEEAIKFIIRELFYNEIWETKNPELKENVEVYKEISTRVRNLLENNVPISYANGNLYLKVTHLDEHRVHSRGYNL